jgi:hypothetical protein
VGTGLPDSSAGFNQFGATVGQSIGDHVVVGSTFKVMHAQSETRGDVDVGVMTTFGRLRAGVNVRNLVSGTFGAGSDALELTRQARAGVAVASSPAGAFETVTVSADVDLTTTPVAGREERHVAGGAEAWFSGRRVAVRGGAGANVISGAGSEAYGSVGATVSPFHRWFVDGAAMWGLDGNSWGIDLRVTF